MNVLLVGFYSSALALWTLHMLEQKEQAKFSLVSHAKVQVLSS